MKVVLWVLVFSVSTQIAETILCYQCADSSDKSGSNSCQTYVRTMNRYRERYYHHRPTNRYVKNCTGYKGLGEFDVYCMIVEVKTTQSEMVRSYIRGCTDGFDFLDVEESVEIVDKVNFENRTECINIRDGLQACVTICGLEHGDFCNGYVSHAESFRLGSMSFVTLLLLCFVITFLER